MKLLYDPHPFLSGNKQRAIKELIEDTIPDRDFYLLVAGAVLLALAGIFLDSIPVLIASMIVAPLMYPILLLSLSIAVGDLRLVARSAAMLLSSIVVAEVIAIAASLVVMRIFGVGPEKVFGLFFAELLF